MVEDYLLIRRMKLGDEDAIEEFVRKYYPRILRYCKAHTQNTADAEDVTQEVFYRFFRNFRQYRHYGKAANYLYVIAGSCCKDHWKQTPSPSEAGIPLQPDPSMETRAEVRLAVQTLPQELKEAAVLFFLQGQKQKDIAKALGIGLPLVKYRIRRSKELLRECLREEEL